MDNSTPPTRRRRSLRTRAGRISTGRAGAETATTDSLCHARGARWFPPVWQSRARRIGRRTPPSAGRADRTPLGPHRPTVGREAGRRREFGLL
eukprot:6936364-Pyramimonas_sp.AAC.1